MKNKIKNLLSFNFKDPSIRTRKKSVIDLVTIVDNIYELSKFLNDLNKTKFEIRFNSHELINKLRNAETPEEFLTIASDFNLKVSKIDEQLLKKSFQENKNNVFKKIQTSIASLNKRFQKINSEAIKNKYQNNIETLHIGAYFLYGKNIEGKLMLSPLMCYPIEVSISSNDEKIVINKSNPIPNEILIQCIKKTYGVDLEGIFNYNENDFEINKIINDFIKLFSLKVDLKTSNFNYENLSKFQEFNDEPLTNEFSILNYACVQLVNPSGGCIKKDIEEMDERGIEDPFEINTNIDSREKYEGEIIKYDDLLEINNSLNIYQKYAIKSSLFEDTVIIGPPGTGKSEVIASIIANAVFDKKRILMSSEKAAALEVLRNRLQSLSSLCLFIYDSKDKDSFYDCLKEMNEMLFENKLLKLVDKAVDSPTKSINRNYLILKQLIEIYSKLSDKYSSDIESILIAFDKINKSRYEQLKHSQIISTLDMLAQEREISYHEFSKLCLEINNLIRNNREIFSILENYKFNLYSKDSLISILSVDKELIYTDTFIYNLLKKNKIIKKISFSDKLFKKSISYVNAESLINFLISLSKIENLGNLTRSAILNILEVGEINNLEQYLIWNSFESFLINNNFQDYESIDLLFKNYILDKQTIAKNNDIAILFDYITYLKKSFIELPKNDQNKIISCLNKSKLTRRPDVNKLIKDNYDVFSFLFPIWICSPEKTCVLTPLKEGIFDYGIFDEASQMFVENSYPLIYRCKTNIVAGDPKQMPPSNWFQSRIDEDDEEYDEDDEQAESLLEKASICNWPMFNLKNHYRSERADLISFSNQNIYNDELEFSTKNGILGCGIEVVNVNGIWDDRHNDAEANQIIKLIEQRFDEYKNKKIIILTFNKNQADYLEDKFYDKLMKNKEIYNNYLEGKILIRNLETIQGDEADIVIMSVTYAPKDKQSNRVNQSFGVLSRQGGYKRLNVAITRAKEKMIVVKSIHDSQVLNIGNESILIFKNFINYVDNITKNFYEPEKEFDSKPIFESTFEEEVYKQLLSKISKNKKYKILTQYPVGKKRIDMVVYDVDKNKVALGIEVDGLKYHSGIKKRLEDLDRQYFLESLGYRIFRITELEWKINKTDCLKDIISKLN